MRIAAVIPAAGQSRRMGGKINKQFLMLGEKPVLAHTLLLFQNCSLIDEIIVVAAQGEVEYCQEFVIDKYNLSKVNKVIEGGKERQDSVYKGLLALSSFPDFVVVHDGARPFLDSEMIEETFIKAKELGGGVVAVPVKDTIKIVDQDKLVINTPERSTLWAVQTPQTFSYSLLISAYQKAKEDNFLGTDDASLVEKIGKKVAIVSGSYENIKITTPEDLIIGQAILERRKKQ